MTRCASATRRLAFTIYGCTPSLTSYYCMQYHARAIGLRASPDAEISKTGRTGPPQGRRAASGRHPCRLPRPIAPRRIGNEPGEARVGARTDLSAGAEIRARRQSDQRQPALLHEQGFGRRCSVFLRRLCGIGGHLRVCGIAGGDIRVRPVAAARNDRAGRGLLPYRESDAASPNARSGEKLCRRRRAEIARGRPGRGIPLGRSGWTLAARQSTTTHWDLGADRVLIGIVPLTAAREIGRACLKGDGPW